MKSKTKSLPWPYRDTQYVEIVLNTQEAKALQRAASIAAKIQDLLPTNGSDEYYDEAYRNAASIEGGITELLAGATITSQVFIPVKPEKG